MPASARKPCSLCRMKIKVSLSPARRALEAATADCAVGGRWLELVHATAAYSMHDGADPRLLHMGETLLHLFPSAIWPTHQAIPLPASASLCWNHFNIASCQHAASSLLSWAVFWHLWQPRSHCQRATLGSTGYSEHYQSRGHPRRESCHLASDCTEETSSAEQLSWRPFAGNRERHSLLRSNLSASEESHP